MKRILDYIADWLNSHGYGTAYNDLCIESGDNHLRDIKAILRASFKNKEQP